MRRLGFSLLCAAVVLLQFSWLPAVRPFGVVPNLVLVLVVLVGLEGTASMALVLAVAGGFVLDLVSGAHMGLWTGVLVLAALAMGLVQRAGIETDSPLVPALAVAGGTVLMTVVIWASLVNTVVVWPVGNLLARSAGELVINLCLMLLLRPLVRVLMPSRLSDHAGIG